MMTSLARMMARQMLPPDLRHRVAIRLIELRVARSPDRRFLRQTILPYLGRAGARLVLVGCRRYTARDHAIAAHTGATVWTLDIDPAVAIWGAPGRHVIAPVQALPRIFARESLDAILLSGIFGFGVDTIEEQSATLNACAEVLRPGGRLVLGWNTDRAPDPDALLPPSLAPCGFVGLPPRVPIAGCTHVFDFLQRQPIMSPHGRGSPSG